MIASGHGLHTGVKSGLILNPLPAGRGIVFAALTSGASVPAHLDYVDSTGYATTLHGGGMTVATVEHLLASLHCYGITNALVKVQSEVPAMDGSALEFCKLIEQAGIEDQGGGDRADRHRGAAARGQRGSQRRGHLASSRRMASASTTRWSIRRRSAARSTPTRTMTVTRSAPKSPRRGRSASCAT